MVLLLPVAVEPTYGSSALERGWQVNRWHKDIATWRVGNALHLSVIFTWDMARAKRMAQVFRADLKAGKVIAGGPAVKLMGAPWADETPETTPFDALAMHNPFATFTTRGCPNKCEYCAVPKIEGAFRELPTWKRAPIICDNNLLVASRSHFERVIDSAIPFGCVDFNQGLDARLFTRWHADQIARVKRAKVRFAFDHVNDETTTHDAIETAKAAGLRDFGVMVLVGFRDTPEDAKYRLDRVLEWGAWPAPMRFQPLDAVERDAYLSPAWTERTMKDMVRYYFRQSWLGGVGYEEYCDRDRPQLLLDL